MVCENSYLDEFDRGIVYSIGKKFAGIFAKVDVDADKPTREKGADSTVMRVQWRSEERDLGRTEKKFTVIVAALKILLI